MTTSTCSPETNRTAIHVACAAEAGYAAHSAVMLHSVMAHAGDRAVHVHYLHGPDFPVRSLKRLRRMLEQRRATVQFHEIPDDRVAGLPVVDLFTAAMWYRIFLPELCPEVDRVLYLDVDTIVMDALDPLWGLDLGGYYLAAVSNVFQREHEHRPAALGLSGATSYFNSGVLLMNLEQMRADGCTETLREFAGAGGRELEWPDQDALNVVLGDRRLPLHPRWNVMNSMRFPWSAEVFGRDVLNEALARPGIRHFEGPRDNKPWHYRCERDHLELYRAHRRETPWPRYRLDGAPPPSLRRLAGSAKRRIAR
jgi:lipopolysaccharide biosynthesis glycosyltransferase